MADGLRERNKTAFFHASFETGVMGLVLQLALLREKHHTTGAHFTGSQHFGMLSENPGARSSVSFSQPAACILAMNCHQLQAVRPNN